LKDQTAIEVKVIVGQAEKVPEEVGPGLSATMEGAVAAALKRVMAELG
jgi:Ni,Fe-hydrogenase maturation factor